MRFIKFLSLLLCCFPFADFNTALAETTDTLRVYWLEPVEVTAQYMQWGESEFPGQRDEYAKLLNTSGYTLIRKGSFFAQDIYVDGFKRSDINVVIDGEHYHNACPNRMDSPLTRVNPMEMNTINLTKSSCSPQSGLSGVISFKREKPHSEFNIKAGITQTLLASESSDAVFSLTGDNLRINGRYASGKSYKDASNNSFPDLYNYKKNYNYSLGELSVQGIAGKWEYRTAYSITKDVMYPYLMMDERKIEVYGASLKYSKFKLYFNKTSHLMDNGLRQSAMAMTTDASNLTIGITADFFEAYFRNWNAENTIATSMMPIINPIVPNIDQSVIRFQHNFKRNYLTFSAKAGFVYNNIGDESKLTEYRALYPESKSKELFGSLGIGISYIKPIGQNTALGSLLELGIEPPALEQLYIYADRPMTNPTWLGNPELASPKKITFRETINYQNSSFELFATRIWDYPSVTQAALESEWFQTYENIDAIMIGSNCHAEWSYFSINAAYTWAKNLDHKSPLAEIPPFSITSEFRLPIYKRLTLFIKDIYADAQVRIDENLSEYPSRSWNKLNAGISYSISSIRATLEVENLLNENHVQHLSYLRNPFSSGAQVSEPGRSIRINIFYN